MSVFCKAAQEDNGDNTVIWCGVLAAINLATLVFYCLSPWASSVVAFVSVVLVDIYILRILLECAERSGKMTARKQRIYLPSRVMALPLIFFLTSVIVLAFAQMYLWSNEIKHTTPCGADTPPFCDLSHDVCGMESKINAAYFSLVTLTTVGYGDYAPDSKKTRLLVMWEISSGILVLLFSLPLVVGRIATWPGKTWIPAGESLPPAIKPDDKGTYHFQPAAAVIAADWEKDKPDKLFAANYCDNDKWIDEKGNEVTPTHWMRMPDRPED